MNAMTSHRTQRSHPVVVRTWARSWRALTAAAVLALVPVAFAACTDGGDSPAATSASETTPAVTEEEGSVAQVGDTVSVHYRGTLDDGSEFDSSAGREPLQFTVGAGQVIPGFDNAVVGMEVGEKKEVRLEPGDAYGERTDDRVIAVPKEQAPDGLEVGQQVMLGQAPATVVEVTDEAVTVDANHPLAGQALTFEIELVGVS